MSEGGSEQTDLAQWIATTRASGASIEQIYLSLLNEGYLVADIERGVRETEPQRGAVDTQRRVVRILLVIGAVLIGAGAFSFVAANWQQMLPWARVALIVVSMTAFSGVGWYLKEIRGYRWTGEALLLVGTILFGAGIYLIAQIFNVHANWPDGLFLWLVGALAMAAAVRSNLLYGLACLVGLVGTIAFPVTIFTDVGGIDPYLLTSPLLAAIAAVVAIVAGLHLRRDLPTALKDRW